MRRSLKQTQIMALVMEEIASLGNEPTPLTNLTRQGRFRGVDFGRIMAAANRLKKQGRLVVTFCPFRGDVLSPAGV